MSTPKSDWHVGPEPKPPQARLGRSTFKRSSSSIATGAFMSLLGTVMVVVGLLMNAADGGYYGNGDDGVPMLLIGGLVGLIGAIAFLSGVVQAARNIDLTAQYVAEAMRSDEGEPVATRRTASGGPQASEPDAVTGETRRSRRAEA